MNALDYAPQGALRLDSIYWLHRLQGFWSFGEVVRLSLAGLTLVDADGAGTELGWLLDAERGDD